MIPRVESIPTAASAMPYIPNAPPPETKNATRIAATIITMGTTVESIPRPIPPMIVVADPVSASFASLRVGLYESEVKYSVAIPMSTPPKRPARIAK